MHGLPPSRSRIGWFLQGQAGNLEQLSWNRRALRNRNPTSPSHHPVCAKATNNLINDRTGTARVTEPD